MVAMKVPLPSTEPDLQVPTTILSSVGEKFAQRARPWIAVGIGASHPDKDWPDATWGKFIAGLETPGTVFLLGGPANSPRAQKFMAATPSLAAVNACDLPLIEAAALLRVADLFVGPSSGPLNLAAAGGTRAFGLFGSTPVNLLEIHPRHRARGRSLPWRHGANCTGTSAGADRALSVTAEGAGPSVIFVLLD
jgi:heptosyltransferase II